MSDERTSDRIDIVVTRDGKVGCPELLWDLGVSFRCSLGLDSCARHGDFDVVPVERSEAKAPP